MYRIRVDEGFHKRCKKEMREVPYNQRGVQERGRTRDGNVSYTHPWNEFLCEMMEEEQVGAGRCDTAMHSWTHTQHTAHSKHTQHTPNTWSVRHK